MKKADDAKMAKDTPPESDNLFDSFSSQLKTKLDKIISENAGKGSVVQNFDKDLHWQKLGLCFQSVSKECTKLAVGFSKPPEPSIQENKMLTQSVIEAVNVFWAWYEAFPISQGRTLSSELEKAVYRLLNAVLEFIHSVKTDGVSVSASRLQTTGRVWEICESFPSVSKDNKCAALKHLSQSYQLLDDALTEVEEEINTANFNTQDVEEAGDVWKELDKPLFQPCLGLIKAGKRLIKMLKNNVKNKGDVQSHKSINELDEIVGLTDKVSPCVDDLVLSLYPPTDHENVKETATLLADALKNCIQTLRNHHYINEDDNLWVDFVSKALVHNLEKLSNATESR